MYTLYYSPGACSIAVHAMLIELGQKFELKQINLAKGEGRTPEYLRINPRGSVPVLIEDGVTLREGAAILMHLAEKHASPLLPTSGAQRREALEWLCFCNSTLHPAYSRIFFLRRNEGTEKQLATGYALIQKLWDEVEARLALQPFLAGDKCTLADLLMAAIANWGYKYSFPITLGPNTKKLLKAVVARPSYQQALQSEGVEYLAAA